MPLTYFSLWMTRLMGLLPDIGHCMVCGEALRAGGDLVQQLCRWAVLRGASQREREARSRPTRWQLAQRMLRAPAAAFAGEPWPRKRGQDLRRFTLQALERHLERKLKTAEALARLGG